MTTELTTTGDREAQLGAALEQLKHSHKSLATSQQARDEVTLMLSKLTVPADGVWLSARIAALLSPYYEKDVPQSVREMEAEDWIGALAEYPRWAVERAVRWWKSADNIDRRKRPLEGDISARCDVEMSEVHRARNAMRAPVAIEAQEPPLQDLRSKPIDPDRAAHAKKVLAGFTAAHTVKDDA